MCLPSSSYVSYFVPSTPPSPIHPTVLACCAVESHMRSQTRECDLRLRARTFIPPSDEKESER